MSEFEPMIPDESEQLDQLQPAETMIDRGVDDVLDEGYTASENWSPAQGFGNTLAEMKQGETLEQRITQEIPSDVEIDDMSWNDGSLEERQVGCVRAGRLVDANEGYPGADRESEAVGHDVGISGGAASAEEAAMHVIDELEEND